MNNHRIIDHPILGSLKNKTEIAFTFDGKTYHGYEGDTIASALLANGIRKLRVHEESGSPRGIYCNIGHCFECRVTVNQQAGVRACMTEIEADMVIESGTIKPSPLKSTMNNHDLPRTYEDFMKMYTRDKGGDSHV